MPQPTTILRLYSWPALGNGLTFFPDSDVKRVKAVQLREGTTVASLRFLKYKPGGRKPMLSSCASHCIQHDICNSPVDVDPHPAGGRGLYVKCERNENLSETTWRYVSRRALCDERSTRISIHAVLPRTRSRGISNYDFR